MNKKEIKYCIKQKTMENTPMKPTIVLIRQEFGKECPMNNHTLSKPFFAGTNQLAYFS